MWVLPTEVGLANVLGATPEKGVLAKHPVRVEWQDGRITKSVVTWYGKLTRSEYRLTRFGRDFPFLTPDE